MLDLLEGNIPCVKKNTIHNVLIVMKNINNLELEHLAYCMQYPDQLFIGVLLAVEYD